MKNYTYGWVIKDNGYTEVSLLDYTLEQTYKREFIASMSKVIVEAKCGWDGVKYAVMRYKDTNIIEEYMVLYCNDGGARWIPITGNSNGCNFSVLGENLW